jgi:nucleotide-binding universal stress UspA family protein
MITLKNVMVATDFSEPSETALDYGRAFARTFGAQLHVAHVVENVFTRTAAGEFGVADVGPILRDLEEAARKELDRVVREDDRRELRAKPALLSSSAAALGLVTYATEASVDLIIIGTHGRGAMSRLLMGSVAERVVRTAPCPVLVVRHPERDFLAPDALQAVSQKKA